MQFQRVPDAFLESEARYKAQIMHQAWGHLEPQPGRAYKGWIVFAHGCHGDEVAIDWEFEDLESSPGFYEDLHDFIFRHGMKLRQQNKNRNGVFTFKGTYKRYKNQRFRFSGKIRKVKT